VARFALQKQLPLPASVTFKAYDWMGNVGVLTVSFTVS